jgi:hypothetical protein
MEALQTGVRLRIAEPADEEVCVEHDSSRMFPAEAAARPGERRVVSAALTAARAGVRRSYSTTSLPPPVTRITRFITSSIRS